MNAWTQLLVISTVSLVAAGGTWLVKGPPTRLLQCDPLTLKPDEVCLQMIADRVDITWVDARKRTDWEKNGMPGSLLWNLDPAENMQTFEAEVAVRVAANPRVIVYCGDENCGVSRQVADRIRALGLGAEVSVLRNGWRALSEAGRVKGSSPKP